MGDIGIFTISKASFLLLKEYFTCWMDPKYFVANQEPDPGPTTSMLSKAAREHGVYIFGGKNVSADTVHIAGSFEN